MSSDFAWRRDYLQREVGWILNDFNKLLIKGEGDERGERGGSQPASQPASKPGSQQASNQARTSSNQALD